MVGWAPVTWTKLLKTVVLISSDMILHSLICTFFKCFGGISQAAASPLLSVSADSSDTERRGDPYAMLFTVSAINLQEKNASALEHKHVNMEKAIILKSDKC